MGRNAILGGSGRPGGAEADHHANGDFMKSEMIKNSDLKMARAPGGAILRAETDSLNGPTMVRMYLLSNRAPMFTDAADLLERRGGGAGAPATSPTASPATAAST